MNKPLIAITVGDAAGIGPELIVKVLSDPTVHDRCRPFIVGDLRVMRDTAAMLGSAMMFQHMDDLSQARFAPSAVEVLRPAGFELGAMPARGVDPALGKAAALYLQTAFELALKKQVQGVVLAPMNKESFHLAGYAYFDELAFLADLTNSSETFILGSLGSVWAVAVTEHIAFKDIVGYIKAERVVRYIKRLHVVLGRVGFEAPRIAVAALNPHGGEGGLFGSEEIDEIRPAVEQTVAEGIQVQGPIPADGVFKRALDGEFDGVVCMYHDQMNIARKLQARTRIATLFMGLPVVAATTAHGTAFDIAGQGIADPGSLAAALEYVIRLAQPEPLLRVAHAGSSMC
jgi:4-phospho-D-threonate 3-dehydrogenase / 4-phospho-D-erythronate 3-dehydrogenase